LWEISLRGTQSFGNKEDRPIAHPWLQQSSVGNLHESVGAIKTERGLAIHRIRQEKGSVTGCMLGGIVQIQAGVSPIADGAIRISHHAIIRLEPKHKPVGGLCLAGGQG
jgi:hypothetical protein